MTTTTTFFVDQRMFQQGCAEHVEERNLQHSIANFYKQLQEQLEHFLGTNVVLDYQYARPTSKVLVQQGSVRVKELEHEAMLMFEQLCAALLESKEWLVASNRNEWSLRESQTTAKGQGTAEVATVFVPRSLVDQLLEESGEERVDRVFSESLLAEYLSADISQGLQMTTAIQWTDWPEVMAEINVAGQERLEYEEKALKLFDESIHVHADVQGWIVQGV